MFEELYKRANDRIDTDEQYRRLMKKLDKSPQKQHSSRISVIRRAEYAAALAACVSLAFIGIKSADFGTKKINETVPDSYSIAEKNKGEINPEISENDIAITPAPQNTPKTRDIKSTADTKTKKPAAKKTPSASFEAVREPEKAESAEDTAPAAVQKESIAAQEPEASAEAQSIDEIKINKADAADTAVMSSGANFYDMQRKMRSEQISDEEYAEYLGINVPEKIDIPEGMENKSSSGTAIEKDEEGNITEDRKTYVFEGNEKYASVTTTRDTKSTEEYLTSESYEKSIISGNEAVIIANDVSFEGHIITSGTALDITAYNFTQTEFEDVMKSLAE